MQLILILSLMLSLVACVPPRSREEARVEVHEEELPEGQHWISLAQFNFKDWELWDASLLCKRETMDMLYNCEYTFHWFDPNYNESTDCGSRFKWDGITLEQGPKNNYSTSYVLCSVPVNAAEYWNNKFNNVRSLWAYNMTITRTRVVREISPSSPLHFFGYPDITMKMMGETENQKSYISTVNPVKVKIQGLS